MSYRTRFSLLITAFVISLLVLGTVGYRALEPGWSLFDAFYMTVITISTVGFAEIRPLNEAGRLFTVCLIFLGLFAVSVIGAHAARLLIDSELKSVLGRKRMKKDIAALRGHTVVCGFGRIGSVICAELSEAQMDFVVIEKDDHLVEQAEAAGIRVLKGDATADQLLREAGIEHAACVVAALNSDAANLFISLAAREINADVHIIARGEDPGIESRLRRAGANVVVSPLKLGGRQIARMLTGPNDDAGPPVESPDTEVLLHSIGVQADQATQTVEQMVRQAGALVAVALRRADGQVETLPAGQTEVRPGDRLTVCCCAEFAQGSGPLLVTPPMNG